MLIADCDVNDAVKVIDADGAEWLGVVAALSGSFLKIKDGGTYWIDDGRRIGGSNGERIELATSAELRELVDVSLIA